MTKRERFLRAMKFMDTDRLPIVYCEAWEETKQRWQKEGMTNFDQELRASNKMNPRDIYDRSRHIPTSERLHECQGGVHNEYANDGSDEAKTKSVRQPNEICPTHCHARFDVVPGSDGYPLAAMPDDGVQSHNRDRLAHSPAGSGADPVVLR